MCTLITAWLVYKVISDKGSVPIPILVSANAADVLIVYFVAELVGKLVG